MNVKYWIGGAAITFSILTGMDAMANPFNTDHAEDTNLTIIKTGSVKLCEGFCNSAKLNNKQVIKNGSTTVTGFPGVETETVYRFANEVGKGCLSQWGGNHYDCKKSSKQRLKRRTEITLYKSALGEGSTGVYKFKMYIPKTVEMTGNDFHRPVQWHGKASDPAENDQMAIAISKSKDLELYTKGIFSEWDVDNEHKIKTIKIAKHGTYQGKWLEFEMVTKYSIDETKGSFSLIVDGKTVYECDPCKTMLGDNGMYKGWNTKGDKFHIGFGAHSQQTFNAYRYDRDHKWNYENFVVYFKDIMVGKVQENGKIQRYYN